MIGTSTIRGRSGVVNAATSLPGVIYILLFLCTVFAIARPSFVSPANLVNIGLQSAILLLISLPMTFIIISEGIDASAGAVLSLSTVVLALVLAQGGPIPLALLAAIAIASGFGLLNGMLVAFVGVPPFIVTLGTLGMAQSIAVVMSGGGTIVGFGPGLGNLYGYSIAGIPFAILLAGASYLAAHVILYRTRFGTYIFAIGGNREALILAGVPARWFQCGIYVLGGVFVGLAALTLTARMNAGHPTVGIGMEFDAIAAVIVGGTSIRGGNGWLFGTLLGVLAIGVLQNGLNLLAAPSALQSVAIGLMVIAALLFHRRSERI